MILPGLAAALSSNEIYTLVVWASLTTGYPIPEEIPKVEFKPHSFFVEAACDRAEACDVSGWYPARTAVDREGDKYGLSYGTVYIDEAIEEKGKIFARSTILHEIVHYLQDVSGAYGGDVDCRDYFDFEKQAYRSQVIYLQKHGVSIFVDRSKVVNCGG